jgi:integrase
VIKLSDTWLKNAKPAEKDFEDTVAGYPGLRVRVAPTGLITFRYRYKRNGQKGFLYIGRYGDDGLSLLNVQTIHLAARKELAQGLDPKEEHEKRVEAAEAARRERAAGDTVADIADQFMHRVVRAQRWDETTNAWVRDAKSTIKPYTRPDKTWQIIKSNLVDKIGKQKASTVTKRQLVELLKKIVDRGSPIQANRAHGVFRQIFEFAAGMDLIPASPMAGVKKPAGNSKPRERSLDEREIKIFWTKLDSAIMEPILKLALRILLLTGQRRGEVTKAYWWHINFETAVWLIPKAHAKNGEMQEVPLSPMALELFRQLHAITGEGVRVLPGAWCHKHPDRCLSEAALSKAMRRNQQHFGLDRFTTHDLRRTAATMMGSLGVKRLHLKKVLNHTVNDITEVYDRHDYMEMKRNALNLWADHLQRILDAPDSNVVPFRKPVAVAA